MHLQIWWSHLSISLLGSSNVYCYINRKNLSVCYADLKTKINLLILTPHKVIGLEVICSLLIHAFCTIFEVNQLRSTRVIGEKHSKTSKIGCFSNFDGPPDPKSKIRLRHYTRLCNTQILRGH